MSTKKTTPAESGPETPLTVGVSVDPRDEQLATLKRQNDLILDALVQQQDELTALKAAQTGVSAEAVTRNDAQSQLDAELVSIKDEFKDYPLIDVFERRALIGLDAQTDIRLKGEPTIMVDPRGEACYWKLRWFNYSKEGRAQQA